MLKFSANLINQVSGDSNLYEVEFSCKPCPELSPGIDIETRKKYYILTDRLNELKEEYRYYKEVQMLTATSDKIQDLLARISGLKFEIRELKKLGGEQKDV